MGFCPSGLVPNHRRRRRSRRCLSLMAFSAATPLLTEALASPLRRAFRALDGPTVSARFRFPFVGGSRPSWTLFWNLARAPPRRQAVVKNVRPVGPNHVPDCKRATTFDGKVWGDSRRFKRPFSGAAHPGDSAVITTGCAGRPSDNLDPPRPAETSERSHAVRRGFPDRRSGAGAGRGCLFWPGA